MTMTEKKSGRKAAKVGVVISDKMDKSVVVRVDRLTKHPLYKKYIRKRAKFMAHDEENKCRIGDTVEIVESRPLSKMKRWRVRRIIMKSAALDVGKMKDDSTAEKQEP
jgi:small subunit ribosomal protein S17